MDRNFTPPPRLQHPLRTGLIISLSLHATALLAVFAAPTGWFGDGGAGGQAAVVMALEPRPADDEPTQSVRLISEAEDVTPSLIDQRLRRDIKRADELAHEEKLAKFEQLARRLETVSSDESIDQMADVLHGWLGTSPRATRPADKPVEGEFDFSTAQLHDVLRQESEAGRWRYAVVLLDARGRTLLVPIEAAEGKSIYDTMQRIKAFPLAEKIYRRLAMPLMDKLMRASGSNERPADSGNGADH